MQIITPQLIKSIIRIKCASCHDVFPIEDFSEINRKYNPNKPHLSHDTKDSVCDKCKGRNR